ncbi:hypothetical protein BDZ94DRAFT_1277200, partial [Collybia nuda]
MTNVSAISTDDKEMISPSDWASSATEMSSPSIYTSSSSSSSIDSRDMAFTRSTTPSPDTIWSSYATQVQCLTPSQPSQHSPSLFLAMTDVLPASRPPNPAPVPQHQKSLHEGSKYKTASIFNPIKFFPRASPPPSLPPPPTPAQPARGRHSSEPYTAAPPGNKAGPPASIPLAWTLLVPHSHPRIPQSHTHPHPHPQSQSQQTQNQNQKTQPQGALQFAPQDRRVSPFRSPRYWFTPGRFFAS